MLEWTIVFCEKSLYNGEKWCKVVKGGVKNVIRRLQLFYQRNAHVEIESELNKGTTFRLFIPDFSKGEIDVAENTDCG